MITTPFSKVGNAYRFTDGDSILWIRRNRQAHTYELVHEFRQAGERSWSVLGRHKSLTAALADGRSLVGNP